MLSIPLTMVEGAAGGIAQRRVGGLSSVLLSLLSLFILFFFFLIVLIININIIVIS